MGSKSVEIAEEQVGDPRFLSGIERCIDKQCKILGLDASQKLEIYDWRKEAREKGLDPGDIFESYVQDAKRAMEKERR